MKCKNIGTYMIAAMILAGGTGSLDPVYSPGQYVRRGASAGGMQLGKPGGTGAGGCPGEEGHPDKKL